MKPQWKESKRLLAGYRCAEHVVTRELALVGRYGEIWQDDALNFNAIIYSSRISRRYLPREQWPVLPGDECLIKFSAIDLPTWIKRLAVPSKGKSQAEFANSIKSNICELEDQILSLETQIQSEKQIHAIPYPKIMSHKNKSKVRICDAELVIENDDRKRQGGAS